MTIGMATHLKLGLIRWQRRWDRTVLWTLGLLLFRRLRPEVDLSAVKRVVIYSIGNVGDIIVTIPSLEAIRRRMPQSEITLLTSPAAAHAPGANEILAQGWLVDDIFAYYKEDVRSLRGLWRLISTLRSRRYELFVSLPIELATLRREVRTLLLARMLGCRFVLGSEVTFHNWFKVKQMLDRPKFREHERIYHLVTRELGMEELDPPDPHLVLPEAAQVEGARLLNEAGLRPGRPFVAIQPGASSAIKRWFPERFAQAADRMVVELGWPIVLVGSTNEIKLLEQVESRMDQPASNFGGRTSLLGLAAVLRSARLVLCNNSGVMHIAAAVGTPTVAVFSARDFEGTWEPAGQHHRVLRNDVPCSPCYLDDCPVGLICLQPISVDSVVDAVKSALDSGQKAPVESNLRVSESTAGRGT